MKRAGEEAPELLDHLDPALLELAVERVGLDRVEPVRFDQIGDISESDRASLLGFLDEEPQIFFVEYFLADYRIRG